MPLTSSGQDDCAVGRLRLDCALDNGLAFWVSGDQLLRGAALNAVEIAELALTPARPRRHFFLQPPAAHGTLREIRSNQSKSDGCGRSIPPKLDVPPV